MSEAAQIILAIGAAVCLILIPLAGVVWAFRSRPDGANYRFPSMLGLIPLAAVLAYTLRHLLP